jgi:hypothetical protein
MHDVISQKIEFFTIKIKRKNIPVTGRGGP